MNEVDTVARERTRVARVYDRYRRSRRKQRAWAGSNPGNIAIRRELLDAMRHEAGSELRSGGEVLDVGCGNGFWLVALRDSGIDPSRLVGVDVLPQRVDAAARLVTGATVREADARSLPFDSNRFSVVLLFTVLSSLATAADVRTALAEARRVLRRSGLLLCYEPRLPSPLNGRVRRIGDDELDRADISPRVERSLTLVPPLARRLGKRTDAFYPRLARVGLLRSHRLIIYRKGDDRYGSRNDEPL